MRVGSIRSGKPPTGGRWTIGPGKKRAIGLAILTLLYAALHPLVQVIPNPMVPGAIVALNMVLPVLAGYLYGPLSGAIAGGVGTALSAGLWRDPFDAVAILPHLVMGLVAGWVGHSRQQVLSAGTILIGHSLNMLLYLRLGLLQIGPEEVGGVLLGLVTETMIDVVAIVLLATLLQRWLYHTERW